LVNREKLRYGGSSSGDAIYAVEDVFGISLRHETEELVTVGDLYELVLRKFKPAKKEGCLRSLMFYKFRRALIDVWGIQRERIRPNVLLETLIPLEDRRQQWIKLGTTLAMPLPSLRFDGPIGSTIDGLVYGGAIGFVAGIVGLWQRQLWGAAASIFGLGSLMVGGLALNLQETSDRAVRLPHGYETVGRAVEQIVSWNYADLVKRTGVWSKQEILLALKMLLQEIFLVDYEEISLDSKFIDFPGFD